MAATLSCYSHSNNDPAPTNAGHGGGMLRVHRAVCVMLALLGADAMAQTPVSLTGNPPGFYKYLAPAKTIDTSLPRPTVPLPPSLTRIFDGKTLKGWRAAP